MIVIDGRESALSLSNFTNLEEVLIKLMEEEHLESRIVTDVLVDDAPFSELYPHQAEDIESQTFSRLELRTASLEEMAVDVASELPKVISIMADGGRKVAELLRQSELAEALEVLQDTIGVSRELLATIQILQGQFSARDSREAETLSVTLGDLLSEIAEVMDNEDWMLVADLLEYEYIPACEGWRGIISGLDRDIVSARAA
jgi:hypothetical protein